MNRPNLSRTLADTTFKEFYYLKEELVSFCRKEQLQATGSKEELTQRISHYLNTGEKLWAKKTRPTTHHLRQTLTLESLVEQNFVCSEQHRAFYKEQIGTGFTFNVRFQKWLKTNAGKTY
ncbi:hypothetical protein IGI37_000654 [Enterococcus sp. AZ194]|uniref:DUF6434 domain-containing protein n=1 Tax=Enterococcus sp. AZ194 TaxID=2774629 RepID=UPI003F26CCCC